MCRRGTERQRLTQLYHIHIESYLHTFPNQGSLRLPFYTIEENIHSCLCKSMYLSHLKPKVLVLYSLLWLKKMYVLSKYYPKVALSFSPLLFCLVFMCFRLLIISSPFYIFLFRSGVWEPQHHLHLQRSGDELQR